MINELLTTCFHENPNYKYFNGILRLDLRKFEYHKIFRNVFFCLFVKTLNYFSVFRENMWWAKLEKAVHTFIVWELTLIRGSEREVHMAISSRVLMSGYLFLANSASNSWSCCEVKWVRCRLWRLSFTLFLLLLLLLLFLPEIKKKYTYYWFLIFWKQPRAQAGPRGDEKELTR